jgi:small subunit ribosomal protein S6
MASRYELLYLVTAQISETDMPQIAGRVTEMITKLGGHIVKDELWGKRKLTYQINHDTNAYYWLTQYDTEEPINAALTTQLNLQPEIIRMLITDALPESDTVPMVQAAQEAATRQEERAAAKTASEQPTGSTYEPTPIAEPFVTETPMMAPKETILKPAEPAPEKKMIDLDDLDRKLGEILDDNISDK